MKIIQGLKGSKQKPYNFTTNTLKADLSPQASSLSAFVLSLSMLTVILAQNWYLSQRGAV